MISADFTQLTVRDARQADLPALTDNYLSESLLCDYLRLAGDSTIRCLVLLRHLEIIGFSLLVFRRPWFWPNAGDSRHLPEIVSFQIAKSERGRGYGNFFLRAIETEASKAGHKQLYLTVAPVNNSLAYALYRRLGYQQLQSNPYRVVWEFADSQGNIHRGENQLVDMMKEL